MIEDSLDNIQRNSYKNFHAKGLDYVCIKRSAHLTEKIYFFDGDTNKMPEVVAPHNHRYNFDTTVLAGLLKDTRYTRLSGGEQFNMFKWLTPLNGGNGFEWIEECSLVKTQEVIIKPGFVPYRTGWTDFHTIRILQPGTVIKIRQYNDVIELHEPTFTFCKDRPEPSLDGLYEKFTTDELLKRLNVILYQGWN